MKANLRIAAMLTALTLVSVTRLGASGPDKDQGAVSVALCEILSSPERYQGKLVHFHARYGGTWEIMYFSDPKCEKSLPEGENIIVPQTVEMLDALKIKIPEAARAISFV